MARLKITKKAKPKRTLCNNKTLLKEAKSRIDGGQSKRSVAMDLGIPEATLRRRLK